MKKRHVPKKARCGSRGKAKTGRHIEALRRALDIVGGQTELARRIAAFDPQLSTTGQGTIWYWLDSGIFIDARYWRAIEAATDQQVTRRDLRPDVFGCEQAA